MIQTQTPPDCAHCWHVSPVQPMVYVHGGSMTAYTCCHCGATKTETHHNGMSGHGPHLPRTEEQP